MGELIMKRHPWAMFIVALLTELGTSFWQWGRYPTDSVRSWYEGSFWLYEAERLIPWAIIFVILWGGGILFSKRALK
jgi:hypothetical protein